jgi:Tol biopolymer transport system component
MLFIAVSAAGLLLIAASASAFPGMNGKIATETQEDSGQSADIWTMNPDGTGQTDITNSPLDFESSPSWSPDGTKLAFDVGLAPPGAGYTMNADGSGRSFIGPGQSLAWSPDGTRIAFRSTMGVGGPSPAGGRFQIFVMNADGSGVRRLTNNSRSDSAPAWSPDGTKIAFNGSVIYCADPPDCTEYRGGPSDIYTIKVDGSGETNLTNSLSNYEALPNWSPDGAKIAFDSYPGGAAQSTLWTMNADGTSPMQVTHNPRSDLEPVWSPDGTRIAFSSYLDISYWDREIRTINPDGTGQATITNDHAADVSPDWQPLLGSNPPPTYQVPKLASPLRFSLVPVFRQCGTGANPTNGQHSPPLGTAACLPPQAKGVAHFGPQAKGTAWMGVIYGDTNAANGDQADATLRFDLSDIRTAGGADYNPNPSGPDGTLTTRLRFTDRSNGPSGTSAGTAADLDFAVPFNCTPTADPSLGSTCALDTSADAVNPAAIKENKATVLQVFRLRLNDSGSNGIRGDSDDRLFATEGIYIP